MVQGANVLCALANIFAFLFAGVSRLLALNHVLIPVQQHDTTAHSLSFALILLAMYPDEQLKLYKDIRSVIPDDHLPVRRLTPLAGP